MKNEPKTPSGRVFGHGFSSNLPKNAVFHRRLERHKGCQPIARTHCAPTLSLYSLPTGPPVVTTRNSMRC